jgi:hypothetical protein
VVARTNPRTPYAIVVRYKPLGASNVDYTMGLRKNLSTALDVCRRETRAWLSMIGGQYPVLFWLVIDTRSGQEYHQLFNTRGGTSNGQEPDPTRRLH